tara:strand:- start:2202 stop:4403 length:2202 start_codon:yes stop_codon:yes gene_type:complete
MNAKPEKKQEEANIHDFLLTIQKRLWVLFAIVIGVVTLTAFWNFKANPVYRGTSKILVTPDNPKVLNFEEVLGRDLHTTEYFSTQQNLMKSRTLVRRLVKALDLSQKKGFGLPYDKKESNLLNLILSALQQLIEPSKSLRKEGPKKSSVSSENRAVDAVLGRLSVIPVRRTSIVTLSFEDRDPVVAAKIANELSKLYLDMNLEFRFSTTKSASKFLELEISKVRKALVESDLALQRYMEKYNIVSLEDRQNIVTRKLIDLNSEVTKARTNRIDVALIAKRIMLTNGNPVELSALPEVGDDSVIQGMKKEYLNLLREQSDIFKRYKIRHPKVLRHNSKVRMMKTKMGEYILEKSKNILNRHKVAKERENLLSKLLNVQKGEALRLNRLSIQFDALKRETDSNRVLYEEMLKRTKETGMMEGLKASNIRIMDVAEVPTSPVRPRVTRNIFISFAVSFGFGMIFIFILEHMDSRFRKPAEIEAVVNSPVLGTLPEVKFKFWERRKRKDVLNKNLLVQTSESFHEIQTMSLFRLGSDYKVVQVTSCIPSEGKTFVTANLGLEFVKANKKILLVDGDIHRVGLREWFDIPASPGILDVMYNGVSVNDAIYKVSDENLSVMPSGGSRKVSERILEVGKFQELINSVRDGYDFIFVDTPPILIVSDPLVWASCVDSVFFVVNVKKAKVNMLRQGIEKLSDIDVPISGVVVNKINKQHNYYYYGYFNKYDYYKRPKRGRRA